MDELLRVLGQLQEELRRTLSANEMIEAAKKAAEKVKPIIEKLDKLLKELEGVNFPQTLKDLKDIVNTTNLSVHEAKEAIRDNGRALGQLLERIEKLKEQLTLIGDRQTKLINEETSKIQKRQVISISLHIITLVAVIILIVLFLMR